MIPTLDIRILLHCLRVLEALFYGFEHKLVLQLAVVREYEANWRPPVAFPSVSRIVMALAVTVATSTTDDDNGRSAPLNKSLDNRVGRIAIRAPLADDNARLGGRKL